MRQLTNKSLKNTREVLKQIEVNYKDRIAGVVCSLICDAKFYGVVVILSDNQLCSPRRSFLERKKKQEVIKPVITNISE